MASGETQNIGPAAAKVPNFQQSSQNQQDLSQQAQIGREASQVTTERSLQRVGSSERDGVRLPPRAEKTFEGQRKKNATEEPRDNSEDDRDESRINIKA